LPPHPCYGLPSTDWAHVKSDCRPDRPQRNRTPDLIAVSAAKLCTKRLRRPVSCHLRPSLAFPGMGANSTSSRITHATRHQQRPSPCHAVGIVIGVGHLVAIGQPHQPRHLHASRTQAAAWSGALINIRHLPRMIRPRASVAPCDSVGGAALPVRTLPSASSRRPRLLNRTDHRTPCRTRHTQPFKLGGDHSVVRQRSVSAH